MVRDRSRGNPFRYRCAERGRPPTRQRGVQGPSGDGKDREEGSKGLCWYRREDVGRGRGTRARHQRGYDGRGSCRRVAPQKPDQAEHGELRSHRARDWLCRGADRPEFAEVILAELAWSAILEPFVSAIDGHSGTAHTGARYSLGGLIGTFPCFPAERTLRIFGSPSRRSNSFLETR